MRTFISNTVRKIKYRFSQKALVLCYHRIRPVGLDPWEIVVSPDRFEDHLRILSKYKVLSISDLVRRFDNGTLKNKMIAVTFDDGYFDNYSIAKPLLEQYRCPATFFIPTAFVGAKELFWWDELSYIVMGNHNLPAKISIVLEGKAFEFDLADDSRYNEEQSKKLEDWIWYKPPPTLRAVLYLLLYQKLQPLHLDKIRTVLFELRKWASIELEAASLDYPMNNRQLDELIQNPLFEIGIHTHTHPALAFQDKELQSSEISTNKEKLSYFKNSMNNTVAYPYGIYNQDTVDVCNELNISAAFTTDDRAVKKTDNRLELGRINVKNWSGEEFDRHLRYWITGLNL